MKKILAMLLALIMVLGMVACGATETTTETTETETTETETTTTETEETETEETTEETTEEEWPMMEASALVFTSTGFTPRAESAGVDHYRENYGLDLEILPVDISTAESWNIFWAGGGYADIILPYGITEARQIVNEGVCRPIEFDWIKEYMPRLYTLLQTACGSDEEILKRLNINGETYCIPYCGAGGAGSYNAAFRADWLEAVGLDVPTTVEEYGEVLRAFTEDDPDGNGVNDTYGATTYYYGIFNVPAAFGTTYLTSYWMNEDETAITTNSNTEEYRNLLRQLNEWYEAGYLDPEFLTDGRTEARSKFANGTVGVYCDNPWWWEEGRGEVGPLQMLAATQNLDYSTCCVFGTSLESTITGEQVVNRLAIGGIYGQASMYFGTEASDELVIRMMKVLDECVRLGTYDEADLHARYEYAVRSSGVEGTHWQVNPETGRVESIVSMTAEEQNELGSYFFPVGAISEYSGFIGKPDEFVIDLYAQSQLQNGVINNYNCNLPVLEGEIGDIYTNVTDYVAECRGKFISGEMDIEADWDTYLAQLEEYGLTQVLEAYEEYFGI